MSLSFDTYWPLVLLALLPWVWWVPGRTFTNFNPRQLRVQAAVRSLVIALAALALAAPVLHRASRRLSIVYAVDVSASVAPESVAAAARWIDEANRAGAPDAERLLAFGGAARPEAATRDLAPFAAGADGDAGPASSPPPTGADEGVDRQATDLEAAMSAALASFAPGHVKHLVLLTDGRPTRGDVAAGVARLERDGVRVFTVPLAERLRGDAWIDDVQAPAAAVAGEPFATDVAVSSQIGRAGVVEIRQDGRLIASEPVSLAPGTTRVTLDTRLARPGAQTLDVELVTEGDPEPANNRERVAVDVAGRPRVLYVEGRPTSAGYLTRALEAGGFDVDLGQPARLPSAADGLRPYAAVVLSDVPRQALDEAQMTAVERYVADLGGGLVMAGGGSMYGVDGYAGTPIERALPATFSMKDRPDEFAMVVVLDKSWSMVGEKIELAKEAARAALDVLPDRHRLGVITFNDGFEWAVPLQPAANRVDIARRIRAIVPSGHTNLFPAVEAAYKALKDTRAGVKHVFILSDGRTYPDEYETLVKKMVADKITLSSVAVGEEADKDLLANLATWGRGRAYSVDDPADVPQIFVKETERALRSTFVEAPFRPTVKKPVEMLRGLDLAAAPPLAGYARMQTKDTAEAILVTGEDHDPVLARWQYGLGRAVVFTSDVKDRWARDWIGWRGYGKFWTQLVRATLRRDDPGDTPGTPAVRVTREHGRAVVDVTLLAADGAFRNGVPLQLDVTDPSARRTTTKVPQVGPGAYRAVVPAEGPGTYTLRLRGAGSSADVVERRLVVARADELRLRPPDTALLQQVSRDTGGTFDPKPGDVFDVGADRAPTSTPLWPYLASLAALLWLADLALRRVRLFERCVGGPYVVPGFTGFSPAPEAGLKASTTYLS